MTNTYSTTKTYHRPMRMTTMSVYPGDIIRWWHKGMHHVMSVKETFTLYGSQDQGHDIAVYGLVKITDRKGRVITKAKSSTDRVIYRHTVVELIGHHNNY